MIRVTRHAVERYCERLHLISRAALIDRVNAAWLPSRTFWNVFMFRYRDFRFAAGYHELLIDDDAVYVIRFHRGDPYCVTVMPRDWFRPYAWSEKLWRQASDENRRRKLAN